MTFPVWVLVVKEGLQTTIELFGEWVFTNYLPQEVQVKELEDIFHGGSSSFCFLMVVRLFW